MSRYVCKTLLKRYFFFKVMYKVIAFHK